MLPTKTLIAASYTPPNLTGHRSMRQYEPIWLQLKKHNKAQIVAPVYRHKTIIQAVRKEKWRDAAYRLLQSEKSRRMKIMAETDEVKSTITFTLEAELTEISLSSL